MYNIIHVLRSFIEILSWFCTLASVRRVVDGGNRIDVFELENELPDEVADVDIHVSCIKKYFNDNAWINVQQKCKLHSLHTDLLVSLHTHHRE